MGWGRGQLAPFGPRTTCPQAAASVDGGRWESVELEGPAKRVKRFSLFGVLALDKRARQSLIRSQIVSPSLPPKPPHTE